MSVLKLVFAPVLIVQGMIARARALPLPEPDGPREGREGSGPGLRLLVVGDSSAAGVGVAHQDQALSGQLVAALSGTFCVTWRLVAKTGNTTRDTMAMLEEIEGAFDVAVIGLGVNDVTGTVPLGRWRAQQRALRGLLRRRFGVRFILASGLPPVGQFPLLPQPTRWVLGREARRFDAALQRDVAAEADAGHLPFDLTLRPDVMAADGFHPGPKVYARWAALAAERIVEWRRANP